MARHVPTRCPLYPTRYYVARRYQLGSIADCPAESIFIGSRAILIRDARGGSHFRSLLRQMFRWGLANQVQVTIIDSSPALVPLYRRLGWRTYADHFQDPALGERVPLVLRMTDYAHLRRIASPFCQVFEGLMPH